MSPHNISQENAREGRRIAIRSLLGKLPGFSELEDHIQIPGFSLHLGDGSSWWIAGSRHASFIAEQLGTIMLLQRGDPGDSHLMFFYDKNTDRPRLQISLLQAQGWINLYQKYSQIFFHPRLHHVFCEYDSDRVGSLYPLVSLAVHTIHWASICRGGLPLHGALLEYQGQGIVLAAPGGTGKSTCSRRVPPSWQARCDDEVLAVLSPEGRYLAHPFPTWADYYFQRSADIWKVEDAIPLAGIFFLEQSPEDDFDSLEGAQAAVATTRSAGEIMLFHFLGEPNSMETRELRRAVFANACEIVKQVPAFSLQVSLTGSFWEKIKAALGWR